MAPVCFTLILVFTIVFLFNFFCNLHKRASSCEKQKMEEAKCSETEVREGEDRISKLPDYLLADIISLLPAEGALRTSVLAKSWRSLWSYASRLDFNQKLMLEPAFQQWFQVYTSPYADSRAVCDACDLLLLQFEEASRSIKNALAYHRGILNSCRIIHITDSCKNGDAAGWIRYLVNEKGVQDLDMECQFRESWDKVTPVKPLIPPKLDLCFHILARCRVLKLTNYVLKNSPLLRVCQNLKTLKLNKVWLSEELFEGILLNCVSLEHLSLIGCKQFKKVRIHSPYIKFLELREMTLHKIDVFAVKLEVIVLDTLVCKWKGLVIYAPSLKVFRAYYCDPVTRRMPKLCFGRVLLTTRVLIIRTFTNLLSSEGSVRANIFRNLVTLCIDLNLNGERDSCALSLALKSCISLENLEINNQDYNSSQNSSSYVNSMLWERRKPCVCIYQKLKTVCITGFKGNELELKFVKYLITRGTMMTRITICLNDDCTMVEATATLRLGSLERASKNLRLSLKAGSPGSSTERMFLEALKRGTQRQD